MMPEIADRISGKWRIVEAAAGDRQHLNLFGPVFIEIDAEGRGDTTYPRDGGTARSQLQAQRYRLRMERRRRGDQVSGDGLADLRDDDRLEGEIAYHNGDDTIFIAERGQRFSATWQCCSCYA